MAPILTVPALALLWTAASPALLVAMWHHRRSGASGAQLTLPLIT